MSAIYLLNKDYYLLPPRVVDTHRMSACRAVHCSVNYC